MPWMPRMPQTASKAAPDTSPGPLVSSKAARHQPRAPDSIQSCPGHYLWLLVTPAPNEPRISSKDCLPGLSCASTLFAATVIAVCIIVTSTSLTFTDVLYIWLLDGYTCDYLSMYIYVCLSAVLFNHLCLCHFAIVKMGLTSVYVCYTVPIIPSLVMDM